MVRLFERGGAGALARAREELASLDGMLSYRISGQGCRRGLFGEEGPFLQGDDRRKAIAYRRALLAVCKALDEHAKTLTELGADLDGFMGF
ncbi:MAG: hypothetical protein DRJ42_28135 [Deltaproteobacteria bacterium]|nr:MAG: hypothetical protein DRJ42_28135 [Deltaproteobacteria bacterium]